MMLCIRCISTFKTQCDSIYLQIAGAGHGVGRELAIQFSMLGSTVICWDIQSDNNEETAMRADLLGYGVGKAYAYTCDITNRDQVNGTGFISPICLCEL
jgi:NADP-dependent 3-hydroxy acid dehydrogenase YdfG